MFWQKKPLRYAICVPPLTKPCFELSPAEAEAYFRWYMEKLDERIDYLRSVVEQSRPAALDLSPKSLVPLWSWFLSTAEIEETPPARRKAMFRHLKGQSKAFRKTMTERSARQFALETEYILRDIGMYLGQVFVKNHPGIHWTWYNDRQDIFMNKPVLMGFEDRCVEPPFAPAFEPIHMAGVQAAKLFDGRQSRKDLYNIYRKWATEFCFPDEL